MLKTFGAVALAIAMPATAVAQTTQASGSNRAKAQTCMNHSTMAAMGQKMDHQQMSGMNMSGMNMAGMDHSTVAATDHSTMIGSCAAPKAGATSDHEGHSH